MKVVDLFAGCGGFSEGFQQAGYDVVAGLEVWDPASDTYEENHSGSSLFRGDIREIKGTFCEKILQKNGKIDVVIGGPPCQGYSVAGNRNTNDPRGYLYEDYIDTIDKLRPKVFVMENVKGLLSMKHPDENLSKRDQATFQKLSGDIARFKDLDRYKKQRE